MKIGVLDIQGSVEEHLAVLQKISKKKKIIPVLVKTPEDLVGLSGLILPGGESTTIGKLLKLYKLDKEIIKKVKAGMAVWGTCAGAILLASEVDDKNINNLNLINIGISRNAYGRQIDSFETEIDFINKKIPAIFIRAPKINRVGDDVQILAKNNNEVVAVRQNNILITTFHPELTDDTSVHEYFVEMCG
ncbi:MAG: pyridoxal 5'-phosphate synthase glutaminase subunit PdxT [Candidatus Magasanikiibacteriota bacterium]